MTYFIEILLILCFISAITSTTDDCVIPEIEQPNVQYQLIMSTPVDCQDICGCNVNMTFKWNETRTPVTADDMKIVFRVHKGFGTHDYTQYPINSSSMDIPVIQDTTRDVLIFVHGYDVGYDSFAWMRIMLLDARLYRLKNFTLVTVYWQKGAGMDYLQSAANTQTVGGCISHFITVLNRQYKIPFRKFHLYGHCLGAHAAGFAGKRIGNRRLGSITAISPAGPGFDTQEPELRLDRGDAINTVCLFVDSVLGINEPICYATIMINGGEVQPGCEQTPPDSITNGSVIGDVFRRFTCSHSKAHRTLLASNSICQKIATPCPDDEHIDNRCNRCGKRNERCFKVDYPGEMIISERLQYGLDEGIFYLKMHTDDIPACALRYEARFELLPEAEDIVSFDITLELADSSRKTFSLGRPYEGGKYKPGNCYNWVFVTEEQIGPANILKAHDIKLAKPGNKFAGFKGFAFVFLSDLDRSGNNTETSYFCDMSNYFPDYVSYYRCPNNQFPDFDNRICINERW